MTWVGAITFLLGSAMGLWSMASMALVGEGTPLPAATARKLVVAGPYRFVRNPMAVAGAVQTVGVGLWLGSWSVLVAAVVGCLIWNQFIRPDEEADLLARFGEPYEAYCAAVRCWLPRSSR
jgi:protein-S-isoprenylcysteine O-methyltransferase Ste14